MERLTRWELVRVTVPERFNALGGDLDKGCMTGKPGDGRKELVARARELGLAGMFSDWCLHFEVVDR